MKPIRVYDEKLNMLTETDNYLSLQFNPRFYEVGEFELHINQYVEGADYFVKGNLIVLDKRKDKAMIIRHREIALDQNGKASENWRITGVTLEGVLDERITFPPEGQSHDRKSGSAETVMKYYVENNYINPLLGFPADTRIEIAPDRNRGGHVEWESRYKNVAEELTEISKSGNLGWFIYADMENKKWVFDVVEPRDVTEGNEAGLQPVFFSPGFSTVKTQQFVDSDLDFRNVAVVGGPGEGADRKIVIVDNSEGQTRREMFVDARDIGSESEEEELTEEEIEKRMYERGEQKLREHSSTFYLEAQILTPSINHSNDFAMSTPFEYEADFRLGDLVEVFNKTWNITMNAPITEFTEIHEPGGFILEATFGEAQPTLITKIRDKFNELEGIEKQELPARIAVERMREANRYTDEGLSHEEERRVEQGKEILEESKRYTDEQREEYVEAIGNMQDQIDGQIQSHFYEHTPTLNNEPAANWTTEQEKRRHEGDLFFDRSTGYAYRFTREYEYSVFIQSSQPVEMYSYTWERIQDGDIVNALDEASRAQDTADSKRRTFLETPYSPYDAGDLWIQDVGEVIKIYNAVVSRSEEEEYNAEDWEFASDITNQNTSADTDNVAGEVAANVKDNANSGKDAKDKIDADVGLAVIETTGGSQAKADSARDEANQHTDDVIEPINESIGTIEFTLDEQRGMIESKIGTDEAQSIIRQEIDSITFSADQINFDGHVFGENATFAGHLEGVTGTFSGNIEGSQIITWRDNVRTYMGSGSIEQTNFDTGEVVDIEQGELRFGLTDDDDPSGGYTYQTRMRIASGNVNDNNSINTDTPLEITNIQRTQRMPIRARELYTEAVHNDGQLDIASTTYLDLHARVLRAYAEVTTQFYTEGGGFFGITRDGLRVYREDHRHNFRVEINENDGYGEVSAEMGLRLNALHGRPVYIAQGGSTATISDTTIDENGITTQGLHTPEGIADIVVEEGSNADGNYIRYANGIQICWFTDPNPTDYDTSTSLGVYYARKDFDFPQPFLVKPSVSSATERISGVQWSGLRHATNTGCGVWGFAVSEGWSGYLGYIAIGRWK